MKKENAGVAQCRTNDDDDDDEERKQREKMKFMDGSLMHHSIQLIGDEC